MFGDIDLTPTIKEYAQILNFSNEPHKVYFRQRIGDMITEVTKLLHLDKVNQYRMTNRGFKWKLIETKLKVNKDEGN
jgi:dUTPase